MQPAIRVDGLSKLYRVGARQKGYRTLRETIADACWAPVRRLKSRKPKAESGKPESGAGRLQGEEFWALSDVSFDVQPGEVVGIIGRNGAGKSTLLKILSRITEPTHGRVELRGRVGSLLEVGTGFHPELTGRENIYMNGSILGMSRREIQRKFDEIVMFAEAEDFLDTPVKRYSSGMSVKLAFAVAAHLEPEILIVDEVLAVGDYKFQNKCMRRLHDVGRDGCTVLVVSHQLPVVQSVCTRCVQLADGEIVFEGTPEDTIAHYIRDMGADRSERSDLTVHPGRTPQSRPTMKSLLVRPRGDYDGREVLMGDGIDLVVDFAHATKLDDITFGFVIKTAHQTPIMGFNTLAIPAPPLAEPIAAGTITCRIPKLPLMPGDYVVDLYFGTRGANFDILYNVHLITVVPQDVFGSGRLPPPIAGSVFLPAEWEITG